MKHYIGISLNDDYTELCVDQETCSLRLPTVVCRDRRAEEWSIGEDAYKKTLSGSGVIVDKLISLLKKDGTATIGKVRYRAVELLGYYIAGLYRKAAAMAAESDALQSEAAGEGTGTGTVAPAAVETATGTAEAAQTETAAAGSRTVPTEQGETVAAKQSAETVPAEQQAEVIAAEQPSETARVEQQTETVPAEQQMETGMVVISIRQPDRRMMELVREAAVRAGVPRERLRVISHTESFVHFVLEQDKNLYNRQVGMFELSNQCLYYYELQVSRGTRRFVLADSEAQEEAFNLEILKTPSGGKIADKILSSLAERIMEKKSYSAVFLTGKGFEETDYAENFMSYLCRRRRVCIEPLMFAIGAAAHGRDLAEGIQEEYTILCDTRVRSDVDIRVVVREKEENFPLASAGDSWNELAASCEMILDRQDYIDFRVTPMIAYNRRPVQFRMPLSGFPERENRTTRIRMSAEFRDAEHLLITVRDRGFGDLFPATDAVITEEIDLKEAEEKR